MDRLIFIGIVLILILHLDAANVKLCADEYSKTASNTSVKWDNTRINTDPECLDADGRYLTRVCQNGFWIPDKPPHCYSTRKNKVCPTNFIELDNYCAFLTEPRPFRKKCTYPGFFDFNVSNIAIPVPIWLPIMQKCRFCKLEYTDPGYKYGQVADTNHLPIGNLSKHENCMLFHNQSSAYVNCGHSNHHLCLYRKKYFSLGGSIKSPNCFSCAVPTETTLDIYLKYDYDNGQVLLFARNAILISQFTDLNADAISCFTDSSGELRSRVDLNYFYKSKNSDFHVFKLDRNSDLSGRYWCEYFTINDSVEVQVTNKILADSVEEYNEFALISDVNNTLIDGKVYSTDQLVAMLYHFKDFRIAFEEQYLVRIIDYNYESAPVNVTRLFLHVTGRKKKYIVDEFEKLFKAVLKFRSCLNIISFQSVKFCMPSNVSVAWPLTGMNSIATASPLCANDDGSIVTRKCVGDYLRGAHWEAPSGNCSTVAVINDTTILLTKLVRKKLNHSDYDTLVKLSTNVNDLNSYDVNTYAEILKNLISIDFNEQFIVLNCISNLMKMNNATLVDSQAKYNGTDKLLDVMEGTFREGKTFMQHMIFENLAVQTSNPLRDNITGLALYGSGSSFKEFSIVPLNAVNKIDTLSKKDLNYIIDVPIENFKDANTSLVIILHFSDNLFNDGNFNNHSRRPFTVIIPGNGILLHREIKVYFPENRAISNLTTNCVYWKYGLDSPTNLGFWSKWGGQLTRNTTFQECSYFHLSHFAFLMMSQSFFDADEYDDDHRDFILSTNVTLQIVTLCGCLLSMVGVVGIFLTALTFRKWRDKIGTKILLCLSTTIFLEIILLGMSDLNLNTTSCTVLGVLLQYVVTSKLCWMLISALLQYHRFVRVVGNLPNRLVLRVSIFGCGFPLVPVTAVAIFALQTYSAGSKFCYPTGVPLYLGVFLPAFAILLVNASVYVRVMYNIFRNRMDSSTSDKNVQKLQVYLAILLFFLLGISYAFILIAECLTPRSTIRIVLIYLFCINISIQGFVLFLFYVLLDTATFSMWSSYFNNLVLCKN